MAATDLLARFTWQTVLFQLPLLLLVYLAVKLLYRQVFPERRPGEPPILRSFLPWFGSLFPFMKDPNAFVDASRRQLGDVFAAIIGGNRLLFVCDHRCFPEVFRRTQDLSFEELKVKTIMPAFGRGDFLSVLDAYPDLDNDLTKHLSGPNLAEVSARFQDAIRNGLGLPPLSGSDSSFYEIVPPCSDLNCKTWPNDGKTWHTVDLLSVLKLMTATNCDVFLGPGTSDQQFRDDLYTFAKNLSVVSRGLPEWFPMPILQETLRARERLYAAPCVTEHTEKTSSALLSRREIFLERCASSMAKYKSFTDVGFMLGSIINTNQTVFWALANLITEPEATAAIRTELEEVLGKHGCFSTDPTKLREQLQQLVKLDAVINEVLRFYSLSLTGRMATEDLQLSPGDETIKVRKGDILMVMNTAVHRNPNIFGDDVDVFRWDRFLTDDKTRLRRFTDAKTGHAVPHPLVTFGGGVSLCPGRHFARDEIKLMAATMLSNFDMELESPRFPELDPTPFAISMPLDGSKLLVRMRRREVEPSC